MTSPYSYEALDALMKQVGYDDEPASYHGSLCGALCRQKPDEVDPVALLDPVPMNFLRFEGGFRPGDRSVSLGGTAFATPELLEEAGGRKLALGVRPEHVVISDEGAYRGRIEAVEYLGTTQIVTLSTGHGVLKARTPSDRPARVGDSVGLGFTASTLALFDAGTGRAQEFARIELLRILGEYLADAGRHRQAQVGVNIDLGATDPAGDFDVGL